MGEREERRKRGKNGKRLQLPYINALLPPPSNASGGKGEGKGTLVCNCHFPRFPHFPRRSVVSGGKRERGKEGKNFIHARGASSTSDSDS